jgi:RecA/RadA recombinase
MTKLRGVGNRLAMDRIASKISASKPRNKEAGYYEVTRTSKEVLSKVRYVLKTGIEPWDSAIGSMPFGRIVELYGLEACGKTAMGLQCAIRGSQKEIYEVQSDGSATRLNPDKVEVSILYVDNEQSLDDDRITVDGKAIDAVLARCDTIDQLFKMIGICLTEIEKIQKEENAKKTGVVHFVVIVVDTVAATSSKEEMTADWGKDDYPRQPKQLRGAFRRLMREINRHNVLLIATNQVSENFKSSGGKRPYGSGPQDADFTSYGGRAIKYAASIRVFMYKVRDYKLTKSRFPAGLLLGFQTTKNRRVKPLRSGRMALLYDRGLDNDYSLLETLIMLDLAGASKTTGRIFFRFKANSIPTTTFSKDSTLEDDDDGDDDDEGSNPWIENRLAWRQYYQDHKADFDLLWAKGVELMFAVDVPVHDNAVLDSIDEDDDE